MHKRREWSLAVRILVAIAGLLAAALAGYFAGGVALLYACEGSPAFGNGGVSEGWVCQEVPEPLLIAFETLAFITAVLAPMVGALVTAWASEAVWFIVGLSVGGTAVAVQFLVNDGQVGVLS